MDSKVIKYILVIILICFKVSAVEFTGKFTQGHNINGKTAPNSKIKIEKKPVRVSGIKKTDMKSQKGVN